MDPSVLAIEEREDVHADLPDMDQLPRDVPQVREAATGQGALVRVTLRKANSD